MTFGSEIVEASYNYDSRTIGPYTLPVDIHYDLESCQGNAFSLYHYYDVLRKDEEALAVFNVNNYCFCVVHNEYMRMIEVGNKYSERVLPSWRFDRPLNPVPYKHIGWVKTYQNCKAVYTWPWKMIQNTETGDVWSFKDKIVGTPLENPPLSLYKKLIETEHKGVYFDTTSNMPVFID